MEKKFKEHSDFFLASSEGYDLEEPRSCYQIKRIKGDVRDDYLLVKIFPPIIGQPFGLGDKDIHLVLLATRHKGASLFPIKEWPVYVHVARVLIDNPEERDIIHNNEIELMAWAELYPTEESARNKKI